MRKIWATIYGVWVSHGTRVIGAVTGLLGVLVGFTDLFPPDVVKYMLLTIGVLTWLRGQFNANQIESQRAAPPSE